MGGGLERSGSNGDEADSDDDLNMTIREIIEMNSSLRYESIDRELKDMKNFVEEVPSNKMDSEGGLGLQAGGEREIDSFSASSKDERNLLSPSPPLTPQKVQHSLLETNVEEFGSVSVAEMEFDRAIDLLMSVSVGTEENRQKIADLTFAALKELIKMAMDKQPLWQDCVDGEVLNYIEYTKQFGQVDSKLENIIREKDGILWSPNISGSRQISVLHDAIALHLHNEASRHTQFLPVDPLHIVELLMDANQYSTVFSNIISKATTIGVLSTAAPQNYDGVLKVMAVEFNGPSALIPTRECHLARYSRQLANGVWAVVDVSLESLFPSPLVRYRRRPSGCIAQQLPNGVSKVIWVEHCDADNSSVPEIFQPLVTSGRAYGARHWLGTYVRQCERLAHMMAGGNLKPGEIVSPGRENVLQLAERMMRNFWTNLSGSAENTWRAVPLKGAENVKATIRCSEDEEGRPPGTAIVVTTSVWIPASPRRVFDFLHDEHNRNKWDILSYGHVVQETGHIDNGYDEGNRVSILEVKSAEDQTVATLLQESYTMCAGFYVAFAPLEASSLGMILNGGNPDHVPILPSGFSVLPDGQTRHGERGSLVTMAFQVLDTTSSLTYIPPNSVATIHKLVTETAESIRAAMVNPFNMGG